jgi:hypothetical protein
MSAATVEAAASTTVEAPASTTVEAAAHRSAVIATGEAASHRSTTIPTTVAAAITIPTTVTVAAAIAIVPATIAVDATVAIVSATVPRAGANEDAAAKPRGTIISIGSASVGGVAVVAIGTHGSRIGVTAIHRSADANSHRNLSVGVGSCRDDQHSE